MTKKKKSTDENVIAYEILKAITDKEEEQPTKEKNPAAVALGRLGGLKGGKARAEKLSEKERSEIAKKAAKARWGK
jgi:hypothetical protein